LTFTQLYPTRMILVTNNIAKLVSTSKDLASNIRVPAMVEGVTFSNLWQALAHLSDKLHRSVSQIHETVTSLVVKEADLCHSMDSVQDTQMTIETTMVSMQETLQKHERRFGKILPILINMQRSSDSSITNCPQR
jgi:hypothetical protein